MPTYAVAGVASDEMVSLTDRISSRRFHFRAATASIFIGGLAVLPYPLHKTIPLLLLSFEAVLHKAGQKNASAHSRARSSGIDIG